MFDAAATWASSLKLDNDVTAVLTLESRTSVVISNVVLLVWRSGRWRKILRREPDVPFNIDSEQSTVPVAPVWKMRILDSITEPEMTLRPHFPYICAVVRVTLRIMINLLTTFTHRDDVSVGLSSSESLIGHRYSHWLHLRFGDSPLTFY